MGKNLPPLVYVVAPGQGITDDEARYGKVRYEPGDEVPLELVAAYPSLVGKGVVYVPEREFEGTGEEMIEIEGDN